MKNSISIWYVLVLSFSMTSCFETKTSPVKATEKPIVVPEINPSNTTPTKTDSTTSENKPTTEQDQSKLSCIQSVCGTEYNLEHEYVKHPEVLQAQLKTVEEQLNQMVTSKMNQAVKNHIVVGEALAKITADQAKSITFSPEQISFLGALKYLGQIKEYYSSLEYDASSNVVFNKEKLKKNSPSLTDDEVEAIASLSEAFKAGSYQQVDALQYKFTLEALRKMYLKNEKQTTATEAQVLKYVAEGIDSIRLDVFSKIFIKDLLVNEIQYVVDKAKEQKELSMKEKIDLIQKFGSYSFMYTLIKNQNIQAKFAKLPFSSTQLVSTIKLVHKQTFQDAYADKIKFNAAYASDLKACKTDLAETLSDTPTAQEVTKAQALMAVAVAKSNEVISRKSSQSHALEIEFFMPKTQDEVIADWKSKFAVDMKQALLMEKTIQNMESANVDSLFLSTLAVMYSKPGNMFIEVRRDCQTEEPSFLSDAALPTEKKLRVSSVVIKNIDIALGVIVHEIGHIAKYTNTPLFKGELSCLESNFGSTQYQDEDFADLFSTKVMSELLMDKKVSTNKNMVCTFPEFKTMKLADIKMASDKKDEHASGLYRLLAVSAASTGVTSQCSTYLSQNEPKTKVFENYCKWLE